MVDSVAQTYMLGVLALMVVFFISAAYGMSKAKNRKDND